MTLENRSGLLIFIMLAANLSCSTGFAAPQNDYKDSVPINMHSVSPANLEYGKNEVQRMLKDRPEMRTLVVENDEIYATAAKFYGGALCGEKVRWNATEDYQLGTNARHRFGPNGLEIYINSRNKRGYLRLGEAYWADFFYEMFNSSRLPDRRKLTKEALSGVCTRDQYIRLSAYYEYLAEIQTFQFYEKHWVPSRKRFSGSQKGNCCTPAFWGLGASQLNFASWLQDVHRKNKFLDYPDGYFGTMFDRMIEKSQQLHKAKLLAR